MIQGALAVVGLGAAYATWQREPEKVAGEVVVVEATKAEVTRVRFEDDKGWVELYLHAAKDWDEQVRHDKREKIKSREADRESRAAIKAGRTR